MPYAVHEKISDLVTDHTAPFILTPIASRRMGRFHSIAVIITLVGLAIAALAGWGVHHYQLAHMHDELRYRANGHALAIQHEMARSVEQAKAAVRAFAEADNKEDLEVWEELWLKTLQADFTGDIRLFDESGRQRWPAGSNAAKGAPRAQEGIHCNGAQPPACVLSVREGKWRLLASVDLPALVESALKQTPTGGFHVRLEQRDPAGGWNTVYTHLSRTGEEEEEEGTLNDIAIPFVVEGDAWRTVNTATPSFVREFASLAPWMMFGALALLALLAGLLIERELALREASVKLAEARRRAIVGGRAMLDAIETPISLIRNDYTYERVNRAFADMHGVGDIEAIEWRKVHEIWGDETFEKEILPHLKRAMRGETVEREFMHVSGGEERHFRATMYPFYRDGAQEGVVVITQDITEELRLRAEREARLKEEERKAHLQEIGLLAGGIAHDINNLLAIIVGETEIARMEVGETHVTRHLDQVLSTSERAARLCKQLLAYAGKSINIPRCLNPRELLEDMRSMLALAAGKQIRLDIEIEKNAPRFFADQGQIEQMLLNLVINAADAIGDRPDGRITVRCAGEAPDARVWLDAGKNPPDYAIRFEVQDNGEGMDEEVLANIFNPFFTTKEKGSGMGLAAVHGIVNTQKGMIRVESRPGRGTRFIIWLPAEDCRRAERCGEEAKEECNDKGKIGTPLAGRVLLVDDEDGVRKMAKTALERLGMDVVTAVNGREACEIFNERCEDIDVVVMDVTMPEMDGIRAAEIIKGIRPDVPIVLCSGYQDDADPEGSFHPDAFLHKPYRLHALSRIIRELTSNETA